MSDSPVTAAINKAYEQRLASAEAQAPQIAARLLRKYRTLAQAIHSAEWHYHGFLQHMIVDALRELHAARETAPAPLKRRIKRPRGVSPLVQAAAETPPPVIRRSRG